MCNEHSLPELGYPRGDHFKTSDEAQSTYWLRLMFVSENGEDLYLGQAIPRYWMRQGEHVSIERAPTHFGPLSLRIHSEVEQGQMRALLSPPDRKSPRRIYVRFRHPEQWPMSQVTLNGRDHADFDKEKEWVKLPGDLRGEQEIVVKFQAAR